eukprot:m.196234 g.196234  ORF g.196234 m.196234 type:complete len:485 (+) comp19717_c0_seq1:59-1513(+)
MATDHDGSSQIKRTNSYHDAVVTTAPSQPASPQSNHDTPATRDSHAQDDVPYWAESGQGARPSRASVISHAASMAEQYDPYKQRPSRRKSLRRCSIVDASESAYGLTFNHVANTAVARRLSGAEDDILTEAPELDMAEELLAVPHQCVDCEDNIDTTQTTPATTIAYTYSDSRAEGGILTFDRQLVDDNSVMSFLKFHNTKPDVAIVVTGWPKKREHVHQPGNGLKRNVTQATRGLPEWRHIIDLTHLVQPFGFIQAPPQGSHHDDLEKIPSGPKAYHTDTAESRVRDYVEDIKKYWFKSLVMTKYVDWTQEDAWEKLKVIIVQDVLQLYYNIGYEGDVVVSFPVRKPFVTVASPNVVNRLVFHWWFRAATCLSLLGLCVLPYLVQLERDTIEVSSHFRIPIDDVEKWWRRSKHRGDLLRIANPRREYPDKHLPHYRLQSLGEKWSPDFAKGIVESLYEWFYLTLLWLCVIIVVVIIVLVLVIA